MTNPDPGVLDIARDAIRAGRVDDVAGILTDQPKLALVAELTNALVAVMRSIGVRRVEISDYGKPVVHLQADAEPFAAAVRELGAEPVIVPFHDTKEWDLVTATILGVRVEVSGPHRDKAKAGVL